MRTSEVQIVQFPCLHISYTYCGRHDYHKELQRVDLYAAVSDFF